uniref:Exported protein n=1 Tax=Strongyloides papillosus TaxID=174720 RepID=A0A0N5B4H9_STREA
MNKLIYYFMFLLVSIIFSITLSMSFDPPAITIEKDEVITKDLFFNEDSTEIDKHVNNKEIYNISSKQNNNVENGIKFSTNSTTFNHNNKNVYNEKKSKSSAYIILNLYTSQGYLTLLFMIILKNLYEIIL